MGDTLGQLIGQNALDSIYKSDTAYPKSGVYANDLLRQLNQMIIYDPSIVNMTDVSLLQDIASMVKSVSARPYFYRFIINPSVLHVGIKKTSKKVLTKGGWEVLYFDETPNEMISMRFGGKSGSLMPPSSMVNAGISDPKFSLNFQRFSQLKNLSLSAANDLRLIYDGTMYTGSLENFDFDVDADNPFLIDYSFTFEAYPDSMKNITSLSSTVAGVLNVSSSVLFGTGV